MDTHTCRHTHTHNDTAHIACKKLTNRVSQKGCISKGRRQQTPSRLWETCHREQRTMGAACPAVPSMFSLRPSCQLCLSGASLVVAPSTPEGKLAPAPRPALTPASSTLLRTESLCLLKIHTLKPCPRESLRLEMGPLKKELRLNEFIRLGS